MIGRLRPNLLLNIVFHPFSQGQSRGRCNLRRRAEDAMRAGTVIRGRTGWNVLSGNKSGANSRHNQRPLVPMSV